MSICIISPEASQDLDQIFEYFASRNVEALYSIKHETIGFIVLPNRTVESVQLKIGRDDLET